MLFFNYQAFCNVIATQYITGVHRFVANCRFVSRRKLLRLLLPTVMFFKLYLYASGGGKLRPVAFLRLFMSPQGIMCGHGTSNMLLQLHVNFFWMLKAQRSVSQWRWMEQNLVTKRLMKYSWDASHIGMLELPLLADHAPYQFRVHIWALLLGRPTVIDRIITSFDASRGGCDGFIY